MERIAATRLRHFGGWIKPRAVTATRPWPGANIESCRIAPGSRIAAILFLALGLPSRIAAAPPSVFYITYTFDRAYVGGWFRQRLWSRVCRAEYRWGRSRTSCSCCRICASYFPFLYFGRCAYPSHYLCVVFVYPRAHVEYLCRAFGSRRRAVGFQGVESERGWPECVKQFHPESVVLYAAFAVDIVKWTRLLINKTQNMLFLVCNVSR